MSLVISRLTGILAVLHERRSPPYNQPSAVPAKYNPAAVPQKRDCGMSFHERSLWLHMDGLHWPMLLKKDGDDLFDHYRHMLESLGIILPQLQYQTPLGRYHTDSKKNVNVW